MIRVVRFLCRGLAVRVAYPICNGERSNAWLPVS